MTEEKARPSMWITVRYVIYGLVVGLAIVQGFSGTRAGVIEVALVFPYVLLVMFSDEMIALCAMYGQYPIYGWILGQAMRRGRFGRALLWVAGVHAAALVVLLLMGWPGEVGPR